MTYSSILTPPIHTTTTLVKFIDITNAFHFPSLSHHSWASLIAQLVKNPPAMQETLVQFLCQEDPLEKG